MKNRKVLYLTVLIIIFFVRTLFGCSKIIDASYEQPKEINNKFVEDVVVYNYRNTTVDPADEYDDYNAQMTADHRINYEEGMISYDEAAKIMGKEIDYFFPQANIADKEFLLDLVSYDYIEEGTPEYHADYVNTVDNYVFQMAINAYSADVRVIYLSDRSKDSYAASDALTAELETELLGRCILLADRYGYSDYKGYYLKQQNGTMTGYRLMLILNETDALRFEFDYVNGQFHREFLFEKTAIDPRIASMDSAKDMVAEAINSMKPIPESFIN